MLHAFIYEDTYLLNVLAMNFIYFLIVYFLLNWRDFGDNLNHVICKRVLYRLLNFLVHISCIVLRSTNSIQFYLLEGEGHNPEQTLLVKGEQNH